MAGRTSFSDLNVNFRAKTKKQYFNLIDKAHKLIKPNKLQVDKAEFLLLFTRHLIKLKTN